MNLRWRKIRRDLWLNKTRTILALLSAVASFLPARRASHLTVREVLAYQG